MMDVGWIFCFANSSAFFNSSAAIITYNNTKTYSLLLQIKDFIVFDSPLRLCRLQLLDLEAEQAQLILQLLGVQSQADLK